MARRRARQGEGHLFRRSRTVTLRSGRTAKKEYGSWKVKYHDGGKVKVLDLGTQDRDVASRKYADWLAGHLSRAGEECDGSVLVRLYLDQYIERRYREAQERRSVKESSINRYEYAVRSFQAFLSEQGQDYLQMENLRARHFDDYLNWRVQQTRFRNQSEVKVTESGANWDLTVLRAVMKRAVRDGVLRQDPTRNVRLFHRPVVRATPVPSSEEVTLVLEYVTEPEAHGVIALLAATGMRTQEAQHLKWQDIDWDRKVLYVRPDPVTGWSPKTERSIRAVPFGARTEEVLRSLLPRGSPRPGDYLFHLPNGRPQHLRRNYPYDRLQSAIRRLNRERRQSGQDEIAFFTCRSLRHFFISWSLNRPDHPLNPLEVQAIVGHTNLDMIMQTYYHPDLDGATGDKVRAAPPPF